MLCNALVLLAAVAAFPAADIAAQTIQHSAIRGIVTDTAGQPVKGAQLFLTAQPLQNTAQYTTSADGLFAFDTTMAATGYLLFVRAEGFADFRSSFSPDSILRAMITVKLRPAALQTLSTVNVVARRDKPPRSMGLDGSFSPLALNSPVVGGVRGILSQVDEGSLARLFASMPGMSDGSLGFYGMSSDQTLVTVNGVPTGGDIRLPLGLATSVQLREDGLNGMAGGFTGANVDIRMAPGSAMHYAAASLITDASPFGAVGVTGKTPATFAVGTSGNGPVGGSLWRYNGAVTGRMTGSLHTLPATADTALLIAHGISADSLDQLQQLLSLAGIPGNSGIHGQRTTSLDGLIRLDRMAVPSSLSTHNRQITVTGITNISESDFSAGSLYDLRVGAISHNLLVQGIARVSEYRGSQYEWLHESQLSARLSYNTVSGAAGIPSGSVFLGNQTDGFSSGGYFAFGGAGTGATGNRSERIDFQSRLVRVWRSGRLASMTFDFFGSGERRSQNMVSTPGAFTFESLDQFRNGVASAYSRILDEVHRPLTAANAGAALRVDYVPTVRTSVRALLRSEAEYAAGDRSFTSLSLSPRLEVAYSGNARKDPGNPRRPLAAFVPVHVAQGWQYTEPDRSWRLRVERYRGSLMGAVAAGISGGNSIRVNCVGEDVPPVLPGYWTGALVLPDHCADGTHGSAHGSARGNAALNSTVTAADALQPPSTWSLSLSHGTPMPIIGGSVRLEGTHRITRGLATFTDTNLNSSVVFRDASGRAVLVDPSAIDPQSGMISVASSRVDPAIGRAVVIAGNGAMSLSAAGVQYMPPFSFTQKLHATVLVNYRLQQGWQEHDGSLLLSGDNPLALVRTGLTVPRHNLSVTAAREAGRFLIAGQFLVSSGVRYTPLADRDVNGDGWINDVAFGYSADALLTEQINALKPLLPHGVQKCVASAAAGQPQINGCIAPWSAISNLRVSWTQGLGAIGRRGGSRNAQIEINLANPVALADRILHGTDGLRGWGSIPVPDRRLLYVRGFDPATRSFRYEVNPGFGQTNPSRGGAFVPYRITLSVKLDVAEPIPVQQLHQMLTVRDAATGARAKAAPLLVAQRIRAEWAPGNPWAMLLNRREAMRLDDVQYKAAREGDEHYRESTDSLILRLAADLLDGYGHASGQALIRIRDNGLAQMDALRVKELAGIASILTAEQIALAPDALRAGLLQAIPGRID